MSGPARARPRRPAARLLVGVACAGVVALAAIAAWRTRAQASGVPPTPLVIKQSGQSLGQTGTLDLDATGFLCARQADGRIACTLGPNVTQVGSCVGNAAAFCSAAAGGVDLRGTDLLIPTFTPTGTPSHCTGTATSDLWQQSGASGYSQLFLCQAGQPVQVGDLLSLGRPGGQQLAGDTAASGALTLTSTANATKGLIKLGTDGLATFNETTKLLSVSGSAQQPSVSLVGYGQNGFVDYFGQVFLGAGFGTAASPQPIPSGFYLGSFGFQGQYDTTPGHLRSGAFVVGVAEETWSATAGGARLTFWTTPPGTTTAVEQALLTGSGAWQVTGPITTGVPLGTTPTNDVSLGGGTSRRVGSERNTGSAAGQPLTVQAGGAAAGGTNLAGGDLVLASGVSTGTGRSQVRLQTPGPAPTSGTSDNALVDRVVVTAGKTVTNGTATAVLQLGMAASQMTGGAVQYTVTATDGTDLQSDAGLVSFAAVDKAGTVTCQVTALGTDSKVVSAGTLTVAWSTATASNTCTLQLTATSSLTVASGYPRVHYTVFHQAGHPVTVTPQ